MSRKVASLVLLSISLVAWVVYMAGVARYTNLCNDARGTTPASCASATGLDWWAVFLALVCIILEVLTTINERFGGIRGTKVAFFIMLQALLFGRADAYCTRAYSLDGKGDEFDAIAAAAAGSVTLLIVNFVLIIMETSDMPMAAPHTESKAASPAVTVTTTAV